MKTSVAAKAHISDAGRDATLLRWGIHGGGGGGGCVFAGAVAAAGAVDLTDVAIKAILAEIMLRWRPRLLLKLPWRMPAWLTWHIGVPAGAEVAAQAAIEATLSELML